VRGLQKWSRSTSLLLRNSLDKVAHVREQLQKWVNGRTEAPAEWVPGAGSRQIAHTATHTHTVTMPTLSALLQQSYVPHINLMKL
jgi:hypothetical protein